MNDKKSGLVLDDLTELLPSENIHHGMIQYGKVNETRKVSLVLHDNGFDVVKVWTQ